MIVRDISFTNPAENILFDDVLLSLAENNARGGCLRFWESPQTFVVLGRTSNVNDDVRCDRIRQDGIPVLRRSSGGGTVIQGPGCLNYSLIVSKDFHPDIALLRKSYAHILGKVVEALSTLGVESSFYPISDLAVGTQKKKVSGNAQKRGRKFILHHGTILYGFDLSLIGRYLNIPKQMPDYRQNRSHENFIANISVSRDSLKNALKSVFRVSGEKPDLRFDERELLDNFLQSREIVINC